MASVKLVQRWVNDNKKKTARIQKELSLSTAKGKKLEADLKKAVAAEKAAPKKKVVAKKKAVPKEKVAKKK